MFRYFLKIHGSKVFEKTWERKGETFPFLIYLKSVSKQRNDAWDSKSSFKVKKLDLLASFLLEILTLDFKSIFYSFIIIFRFWNPINIFRIFRNRSEIGCRWKQTDRSSIKFSIRNCVFRVREVWFCYFGCLDLKGKYFLPENYKRNLRFGNLAVLISLLVKNLSNSRLLTWKGNHYRKSSPLFL